jgi:hypothetical protein
MKLSRYTSVITLIMAIPFILKSFSLFNTINNAVKDGDGIGLYFLGFEINDRLRFEQIPQYSLMFLIIGMVLIISSIFIYIRGRKGIAL